MNDARRLALVTLALVGVTSPATAKTMLDYFQPIPIRGTMTTSGWGIGTSGPRDTGNGLEDIANWRYWDGKILKADDGKYHLFCSKWQASKGIAAWMSDSISVHAVSDHVLGPYKEIGLTYTYQNGRGHNTTGLKLIDGTYAVIESAIVPGWIFTSSSLDGPFNYKGSISTDNNGFNASNLTSNLQIIVGPDDKYWAISGSGFIMNGDNILGTYKVRTASVYMPNPGMDNGKAEDPILWYSGGFYHVVYNYWDQRKAYHIMSADGVKNWKNTGLAVDRSSDAFRYTDDTVNHWGNMERPNVVMENGHVTHFTFAVTDVNKDEGSNCCSTGSKIFVVPFDGVAFDADNGGQTPGSGGAGGGGGSAAGGAGGRSLDAGAGGSGGRTGSDGGGGTSSAGGGGSGGSSGNGGASGGSSDAAGRTGSGGTSSAGTTGSSGSGGSPGTGGANGTGGSGSGGTDSSAGTTGSSGSGGSPGAGGANGTGGSGSGGITITTGSSSGGSTGAATSASGSSSGCSCSTSEAQGSRAVGLLMFLAFATALAVRRYGRNTLSSCSVKKGNER
jgi:MYXO-CTERM domain-containing protein